MNLIYIKTLFLIILIFILSGCSFFNFSNTPVIRIKGSDTMLILTTSLADEYNKINPDVKIIAEGGGTAIGIKNLSEGEIEVCAASRTLRAEEAALLAENYNSVSVSFLVAKDALSMYVNPANPVKELTTAQLKDIFTGKIRNWKELSGDDAEIIVLNRSNTSGTYLYFKEHILNEENYLPEAITFPSTEAIISEITINKYAIGYGGIAYGKEIHHCKINGISPVEENVKNGSYPISRYLYFYTVNMPKGKVKNFIDWVISPAGQAVVRKVGYIPLWI